MTNIKVGNKIRFTPKLRVDDFTTSKREYLLGNMNTIFTVKKVQDTGTELEFTLDEVYLNDCYFKEDEIELVVENSSLTPIEYNKQFDEIVFKSLLDICQLKGIELESSSELLQDIRCSIISHMLNYRMNVNTPQYKVGDTIYIDNEECKVIQLGEHEHGVLSVQFYNVIARGEGSLLEFITYLEQQGRLTVE